MSLEAGRKVGRRIRYGTAAVVLAFAYTFESIVISRLTVDAKFGTVLAEGMHSDMGAGCRIRTCVCNLIKKRKDVATN